MGRALRIRPVRRYRPPRYPSCWRPWGGPGRRARRGAALLALPTALGAQCNCSTEGASRIPEPMYLTHAEGEAVLDRVAASSDWTRTDACPTVVDRMQHDVLFEWTPPAGDDHGPVQVGLDDLAPTETLGTSPGCAGGTFPAVGLGFFPRTGDGTLEGPGAGVGAEEQISLAHLRSSSLAAIGTFDSRDYSYTDPAEPGYGSAAAFETRGEAEVALEEAVRAFIAGLRSDGFL